MRLGHRRAVLGIAALAAMLAIGTTANAAAPISKCNAAKKKCIGKYIAAAMGCHAKAEGKGTAVDPTCLAKATAKITGLGKGCFDKNDAKVGNDCTQTGDAGSQLSAADAFILDVVNDVDPAYPAATLTKCGAARKKCVGKKAAGLMGCAAKENKDGVGDPACAPKIQDKFGGVKGCDTNALIKGTDCLNTGSATTVSLETKTDAWQTAAANAVDSAPPACPAGGTCGDGCIDPGEFCDPGAPNDPAAACGAGFACNGSCNCACPTKVTFSGDPTSPLSVLDTGWTGISHRAPIISDGQVTVALSGCANTVRPCGQCNVTGPIANPNAGAGQIDNQRCSGDTSVRCTSAPGGVTGCGGPLGTCEWYFGSALPLAAGGVTTCVVNRFAATVTGTANVETGEAVNSALLSSTVYTGIAIDNPCARCNNDPVINDGVQGGTCTGGVRNGLPCDANGTVPARPDYGKTSLDCPLAPGAIIAVLPIDLTNATDPVVRTVTASSPGCSGEAGEKCLCDTCNNINQEPCDNNADCPDPAGPIGPICGGKRCIGGTNNGAACNNTTECPSGGICGRPGEPTKPSACLDDTATVNTLDCTDLGNGEGQCTQGPITTSCSVASGHAQRGCISDTDCGGGAGSCESNNRLCFLTGDVPGGGGKDGTGTLIAAGMEDPPMHDVSNPTLGAVFCVGPTGSSAVNNVAGLPGPGRVTIHGTAVGLP